MLVESLDACSWDRPHPWPVDPHAVFCNRGSEAMPETMKKDLGPLTWAYCILVGLMMITPEGIGPIYKLVGFVGILLGAYGFMTQGKPTEAGAPKR
jgi:hypothetical protein